MLKLSGLSHCAYTIPRFQRLLRNVYAKSSRNRRTFAFGPPHTTGTTHTVTALDTCLDYVNMLLKVGHCPKLPRSVVQLPARPFATRAPQRERFRKQVTRRA